MPQMMSRVTRIVFTLLLVFNIYGLSPAEAAIISTKEEISIGTSVAKQLEKQYGLVDDQELQDRVARIGASLAAVSDRRDLTYSFKVLNSKDVNALALPGGFVYVFKGLIDYMPSDEELAGVLSHEVSHVVRRHTVRQMEKSLMAQILLGVLFGDRGVFLQNLAFNAIMAGYSRADEQEADRVGFYQAVKAGYNPYSMLMTLQKLDDLDKKSGGSYSIFASHPEPAARVNLVKGYIESMGIKPGVSLTDQEAAVTEGSWQLPAYTVTTEGYKPLYRAYFTAGALYQVSRLPNLRNDHFIVLSDEDKATIYYDDIKMAVLTQQDAAAAGISLAELTDQYIFKMRDWTAMKIQKTAS